MPAAQTFHDLNATLNLYAPDGSIQFHKDLEAVDAYMEQHVAPRTRTYPSTRARLAALVDEHYYEPEVLSQYSPEFLDAIYAEGAAFGHKFSSYLGALKFFTSYALKSFDGKEYLEDFTQRATLVALTLAEGNQDHARALLVEILSGRFQPATPTFLNAGKAQRGELVSCFLLRIEDNMESISRSINSSLQLSKRGGGVALLLTNIREEGAPIKKIENQSSGIIPVMKLLEDSFSYANQLGARQGAGAVYLSAHHPDIMKFLDTKRENADEKIRIKTLSLGVVIPDVAFELARRNERMYLFSPYDVERVYGKPLSDIAISDMYDEMVANPEIKKTHIDARKFFQTLAELQFESGYPYVMFEDTVNRANPIEGRVNMSNLCSEILQVNTPAQIDPDLSYSHVGRDISCNLGSLNVAAAMDAPDFAGTIETAVRALTSVSRQTEIEAVPTVVRGNDASHAIGLGQMNLHGYFGRERVMYGSPESIEFTSVYFAAVTYYALTASNKIAAELGETFEGFERSKYADGSFFDKYVTRDWLPTSDKVKEMFASSSVHVPTREDWAALKERVMRDGIYNAYLQAVPPTGSISYINHSTSSIHPIASKIEIRKEGKVGRTYYPAPHMDNTNLEYFQDAYEIGAEKIIEVYAAATEHVDQGLSLTLFFKDTATTRDINRAQILAWRKGIKTLYYIRLRQMALTGTEVEGCVSCML